MAEMDGTSRNHKKDDIMRIRNYTFPSILMEILEIDRYIVNCHDAILENPSNVMDINIANMLDDYIVYNFLQGMVKGRKSVEFAMDLLRVFNFYQEKQLLYNNEVKRDLINKARNDFSRMDKNVFAKQFWVFKIFTPYTIDYKKIWCSYIFAPRYLLRLFEYLPLYYVSVPRTWKKKINMKLFCDFYLDFFTFIIERRKLYFLEFYPAVQFVDLSCNNDQL